MDPVTVAGVIPVPEAPKPSLIERGGVYGGVNLDVLADVGV